MSFNKKWINTTVVKGTDGVWRATDEYAQWKAMRKKTSAKYKESNPTYRGCTYVDEWESYDVWVEWARQQVGFLCRDYRGRLYQNDKDLLVKGNKCYSPDVCVFVPQEINSFILSVPSRRGDTPIGVSAESVHGRFVARLVGKHLGSFLTPQAASAAYNKAKEAKAQQLLEKYRDNLDERVQRFLATFQVDDDIDSSDGRWIDTQNNLPLSNLIHKRC